MAGRRSIVTFHHTEMRRRGGTLASVLGASTLTGLLPHIGFAESILEPLKNSIDSALAENTKAIVWRRSETIPAKQKRRRVEA